MARVEPSGMILRRLYDLPVFTAAGTLSITSRLPLGNRFFRSDYLTAYLESDHICG
ncbi:hypothetical protein YWA314_09646 [Yersinia enterocolitica subsp. enterocolitica WA-314]|nr:hypothetical protein YWA314_09646 [Yersinia enterocolitica subsp. enterocolitica WA-314]